MACWRFQDDINLWLSHIDFCKRRSEKAPVSNLYVKMLQIHNKKPALWVMAAKWEMEESLSMDNARGLLQRGLRFNPTSDHLWQEYFRMELLNADKLRKRREILGLAALAREEADISDMVLKGQVAQIVFKKALESIPGNAQFCLSFLPLCRLFNFTNLVEEEIFACLQVQFPADELVWEATALRVVSKAVHIDNSLIRKEREKLQWECDQETAQIFNKAVKQVNTEKMWSLYIHFCTNQLKKKKSTKTLCDKRAGMLLRVYQMASDENKLSAELYSSWIDTLCHVGEISQVQDIIDLGITHYPHSLILWLTKLRLTIASEDADKQVKTVVEQALDKVKENESYPLWQLSLSWAKQHNSPFADKLLESGVLKCAEICVPLKKAFLDWAFINNTLSHVRELYKRLCTYQPLSVEFFQTYIDIEQSQAEPKIKRIRQAYEDAIREYGSCNTDIWLNYIKLEMTHPKGKPQEAGHIHWRALKTLDGHLTEKFVTIYTLLQTGNLC